VSLRGKTARTWEIQAWIDSDDYFNPGYLQGAALDRMPRAGGGQVDLANTKDYGRRERGSYHEIDLDAEDLVYRWI